MDIRPGQGTTALFACLGWTLLGQTMTVQTKAAKPTPAAKKSTAGSADAIVLLEADHREVEGYFDQYEGAKSAAEKKSLARSICGALRVHAQIEEEIFYPAARKATKDNNLLDEATVGHAGAKVLIPEIEASQPASRLYAAR